MSLPRNKSLFALEPSVVLGLCLVVDGGCAGSTPIQRPSSKVLLGDNCPWMRLSIIGQDLHLLDCTNPHRGVSIATASNPSLSSDWLGTHH